MFSQNMKPWQGVLLVVLIIVIVVIAFSLPEKPLGNPCMDAWCLNH